MCSPNLKKIIWFTKSSSQQKIHMQPFLNITIWYFTCFANKEHTHMSHSRTSTTTNILSNTLLNPNHSKHHQIQLQALSTIMLLLILSPNKHIYYFSDIKRTTCLGLRLLWVVDVIKTWLPHKFHMLRFYNLITMKKINCYCKKTCKTKINLKIIIFYKHIAIL